MSGGWLEALAAYRNPRVLAMLFLGFSAGLPFMLVFSTLSAWLRDVGVERATIGMLSWVGIVYSIKFFWAPVVDRLRLPLLHDWLGRRRSWMLVAQLGIVAGLARISTLTPPDGLGLVALAALFVAFCSATQDIAIDAWRIESVPQSMQGPMAAAYQLGYRVAIMVGSAGALWIAADLGWDAAYLAMAALGLVGVATTLLVPEPQPAISRDERAVEQRVVDWVARRAHWPDSLREVGAWFVGAVVCPFVDFFARYGSRLAVLILAFVASYRLTDFTMGVMANPFYLDVGFSLKEIAAVAKGFGLFSALAGTVLGGAVVAKLGTTRALVAGSVLVIASNLLFMTLAFTGEPSRVWLATVVSADNLAMGVAGTALIAYLSGLTSPQYTATQYALFSSAYALPGKLLMGASGFVVDAAGYPSFFIYTSCLGLPALLLLWFVTRAERERGAPGAPLAAGQAARS